VTYDDVGRRAVLTPRAPLAPSTTYTARVRGGTDGILDSSGEPLAEDRTWTFTTMSAGPDRDSVQATDNCATVKNPSQKDTDKDGVGDACEIGKPGNLPPKLGESVNVKVLSGEVFIKLARERSRRRETLRLRRARSLPLGASPAYARRVDRALRTLGRARAAAVSRMGEARTPGAQATAATAASRALARARAEVATSATSPYDRGANSALAAALRRSARAYDGLARAARAGDRAEYLASRRAVAAAEDGLAESISDLRPLGYAVGS
jgi:hypothetical protein